MIACVMSSNVAKGVSKRTGKEFNAIVVHVVFYGEVKECEAVWIDPEFFGGVLPSYGDVIDIQYNRQGYVQSVTKVDDKLCELVVNTI